ncbi:Nre family DNA repair protein [Methanomethylovorans sp.]|uniref:Nre family DNA repair protein n=1 Tax=Methanomethylovorans sp. TaxID=2758717 RepID=UPI000A4CDB84|nr:Nre family DNA repair protein [Methanomethylovorans sp.]
MSHNQCVQCKGRGFCGRPACPILEKFRSIESYATASKGVTSIFGASPPAIFIGRHDYPSVMSGPMVPPDMSRNESSMLEDPKQLLGMNIDQIIAARSMLVRAGARMKVKDAADPKDPLLLKSQELALSMTPVDTEVWFNKPLSNKLKFDSVLTPMGPSGDLKDMDIAENPDVPKKVDYLVYDDDALAKDVVSELNSSNISQEHITRLLSIGLLGKERKLVPTRWSITAVDDMLGKEMLRKVRDNTLISNIMLFSGGAFGNHFEILLIPRAFSYELIEIWMPRAVWSGGSTWIGADGEGTEGKKGYSILTGGYYAARLGVLEYLNSIRRQATVFMIREIRPDYWAPLGVWVIREAVRNALQKPPQKFESIDTALSEMSSRIHTPAGSWRQKASLIDELKYQKTLDFFL